MKRVAIACALALSSHAFAGDTAAQLVQACQSLKRQEDRNVCLVAAVKAVSPQSVVAQPAAPQPSAKEAAQARIAKALEASQAIQSIASSGTSYLQYTPYVQQFSIALDQFRAVAQTPEEKDAAALLGEALRAYSDAATYWQADINFFSRSDWRSTYPNAQPTGLTGTRYILDRYDVPIQKADFWGLEKGAPLNDALEVIWLYAQNKTNDARDAVANLGNPAKDADTRELKSPIFKVLPYTFQGGAYAAPDTKAERVGRDLAGRSVYAYAQRNDWYRVSPKGEPEEWLPVSEFH